MLIWVEYAHIMKHNPKDDKVDVGRLQKQAVVQVKRIIEPFIVSAGKTSLGQFAFY